MTPQPVSLTNKDTEEIIWTYDVQWAKSDVKWASRWDLYLKMTDSQIHWFSIINSTAIVLFLSAMLAMIMMRTLHRDFRRYNEIEDDEEAKREETGWKLVHTDVFRPPQFPTMLCVMVGTGYQLLGMAITTLFFAVLGFLSPANRGALMLALLLLFVFMGVFAGYGGTRLYMFFSLTNWISFTFWTAVTFPGICFTIFFILNMLVWGEKSTGAVPFSTLVTLIVLWFGISVPLVYLGSYFAFKRGRPKPVKPPTLFPKHIPEQAWYLSSLLSIFVGGILPFGACFIEIFFIMSSVWLHQFYYMFGFLFIVFVILVITCAEITIVMCYFQLCHEVGDTQFVRTNRSFTKLMHIHLYSGLPLVVACISHCRKFSNLSIFILDHVFLYKDADSEDSFNNVVFRLHVLNITWILSHDWYNWICLHVLFCGNYIQFDQDRVDVPNYMIILISKNINSSKPLLCNVTVNLDIEKIG